MSVTPICTVARNDSGLLRSFLAATAPPRFSATSWSMRVLRTETSAISAPEKSPFPRSSRVMMTMSVSIRASPL